MNLPLDYHFSHTSQLASSIVAISQGFNMHFFLRLLSNLFSLFDILVALHQMESSSCDEDGKPFKAYKLSEISRGNVHRRVRVYADGVYDLLHYGHLEQLKKIKDAIPNAYVMVGVCTDKDTLHYKGKLPVMSQGERERSLELTPFVDQIISQPPFFPALAFLNEIQADLMAHDPEPYPAPGTEDCYKEFKIADRFLETRRTPGISTTDLVNRILQHATLFEKRSCAREEAGMRMASAL